VKSFPHFGEEWPDVGEGRCNGFVPGSGGNGSRQKRQENETDL
jgi:hypothetical protein